MSLDTIIKNGSIVDGTGNPAVQSDLGIQDGKIAKIGDLSDVDASKVIDATDQVVTPGFVDLHTHLDAQVFWDPELTSSSFHGVTTALIGNCGVGFAPVSQDNRAYMAKLMESVEDIAAEAILDGMPWDWTSYGGYLDSIQALNPALNIVGLAGHSSIRFEVMGDRSMDKGVQADDEELAHIVKLVEESVAEGAVGFSTSRFLGHFVPDGRLTPGTWADLRETRAIQEAAIKAGGTGAIFQTVNDFQTRFKNEFEMMEQGAELGCQILFSSGVGQKGDGGVSLFRDFFEKQEARGYRVAGICQTRPSGAFFGLAQMSAFTKQSQAWRDLMALPNIPARVEAMSRPDMRQKLIDEGIAAGTMKDLAPILHPFGVDEKPDLDLESKASLKQLAEETGVDPVEIYVDRLIASEGREFFNLWMFGAPIENQWKLMRLPNIVPMLGDAGAHVGFFTDTDSPTVLLSELTRKHGVYSLEEAIHKITKQSADILGLKDRGVLKEGYVADINVIDYENLSTRHPEYVNDFPHGGGRFVVKSHGYTATLVAGNIVVENCKHTGARPGQVIREFARG